MANLVVVYGHYLVKHELALKTKFGNLKFGNLGTLSSELHGQAVIETRVVPWSCSCPWLTREGRFRCEISNLEI